MTLIKDPRKSYLINPQMEVKIIGEGPMLFEETSTITISNDLHMDFNIEKDLEEEPNEADVTIYNLSDDTRKAVMAAANRSAPVEIYLTAAGTEDLVLAFKGELDSAKNRPLRPGHETVIHCVSQKTEHRSIYIDNKTYKAGTPKAAIIADFVSTIGMPVQRGVPPTTAILLSQSFSGPAFPLLKKFVEDLGSYCWINDGVLHISSCYVPTNPAPKMIYSSIMLGTPEETDITDNADVEMRTITEKVHVDPFQKKRKKKKKTKKKPGPTGYVEFEGVETEIPGMDFPLLCQPDLQPDDLVTSPDYLPLTAGLFRVRELNHYGDNYGGDWNTDLRTSTYMPPEAGANVTDADVEALRQQIASES